MLLLVKRLLRIGLLLALAGSAAAQPAPWYKWRSKLDGRETCRQVTPGEGWERVSGPYKDASCTRPGVPGR